MRRKKKIKCLLQFGKNLKKIRLKVGISQEKLSILVGVHRTTIGELERGDQNPSLINLTKLAGVLNVTLAELLEGVEGEKMSQQQIQKRLNNHLKNIMKEVEIGYSRITTPQSF
jgi:transcriptional regulator with XRE-family HTH domain